MSIIINPSTGQNIITVVGQTGNQINVSVSSSNSIGVSSGPLSFDHEDLSNLQGGSANQYYHLNSGQYVNLVTGDVIRPSQTGQFYPLSNPSGFITGVNLTEYATTGYVTGASGVLQTQITILNNQTGSYYLKTNPSGYITGISNIVYTTGDQNISGAKTFLTGVNISGNLTISGTYNVYQQIENTKILAIAYAIAL